MALKLGTKVRQIVYPIEGTITDYMLDKASGEVTYHVEFTDAEGEPAGRYFKEEEFEVTADAPAPVADEPVKAKKK